MKFILTLQLLALSLSTLPAKAFFENVKQATALSACDMSTTSCSGTGQDVYYFDTISIQAVFSGTPVGTFKLQISNDAVNAAASVTNWSDYTGSSTSISAAGDYVWNLSSAGYRWVRVVYTKISGTGTANAYLTAKGN